MAQTTGIAWCDSTFNPWVGCTKVSAACDNCYAERDFDLRRHVAKWGAGQPRKRTSEENWKHPISWNAKPFYECDHCGWRGEDDAKSSRLRICQHCGTRLTPTRRRVFCASLADVFDNQVDPQWRADLFALIEKTPNLDWLILTKRIGNVERMTMDALRTMFIRSNKEPATWPWPNIWLGATVSSQSEADRDIPKLLTVPAAVRFLSIEPMLGPISFVGMFANQHNPADGTNMLEELDWVICGGESGPKARPMHPDWVRSLRDQCSAVGVPFLFKQWGEWAPGECAQNTLDWPKVQTASLWGNEWKIGEIRGDAEFFSDEEPDLYRAGKKATGRKLDGREHNEFPEGKS